MNKGFTLVELLAVIVILSALVAITLVSINPIVKDSKEGLTDIQINNIKESASLYYVKYGMGLSDFEIENPKDCINVSELIENGYIDNDEVINPKTGEKILGSVKVTYNSNNYIYEYQDNACTKYDKGIICERVKSTESGQVPEGNYVAGDAYNCKVDPTKAPYKFYILTTPDTDSDMVNLIMDRNICDDGLPTAEGKTCLVAWSSYGYTDEGPVVAMTYLYNATKNWINIPALNYTYNDEEFQGLIDAYGGYTSFVSKDGIATITSLYGEVTKIGSEQSPLKARMPIYSRDSSKTEVADFNNNNGYLYENLTCEDFTAYTACVDGVEHISGIYGYWTASSMEGVDSIWTVRYPGVADDGGPGVGGQHGVRPVISIYKFQME